VFAKPTKQKDIRQQKSMWTKRIRMSFISILSNIEIKEARRRLMAKRLKVYFESL